MAAAALRAGVEAMSLEMFPDPSVWSNTVSCVRTPAHVEPEAVVSRMRRDHGIAFEDALQFLGIVDSAGDDRIGVNGTHIFRRFVRCRSRER